jgi:hypothetical protein
MKKIRFAAACSSAVVVACVLSLAHAQIPGSFKGKFPKPKSKTTRWTYMADMNANVPIIILINRSGGTLTGNTRLEIYVDDDLGVMGHGGGNLPDGQQRIIAPYIRSGGTVRMLYEIDGRTYPSWHSKGPLQAGVPMVLTIFPKGRVTVNEQYARE